MEAPILVTGSLGNVGTQVVESLLSMGRRVRAADRNVEKLSEHFGDSVECAHFDFSDPSTYAGTFEGVERMFLMRPPQISNVKRDMFPAIDAAKQAGVKKVVFLSVIGIEHMTFIRNIIVWTDRRNGKRYLSFRLLWRFRPHANPCQSRSGNYCSKKPVDLRSTNRMGR